MKFVLAILIFLSLLIPIPTIADYRPPELLPLIVPLGEFTVTYYDADKACTGKSPGDSGYGITSSGLEAKEYVTVAVDPKVIPLGTEIFIEGVGVRIAQDTGSKDPDTGIVGNRVDVFVATHKEATQKGRYLSQVYLLKRGGK